MAEQPSPDIANLMGYGRRQLDRFRSNLGKAMATEDIEAVHDLRVASRRLHDLLGLMATWVGRKRVGRVRCTLRDVRRAFREVRDLDVLRLSLSEHPHEGAAASALAEAEAILARRRARAAATAKRIGRRAKVARHIGCMESLCEAFERLASQEPALLEEQLRDGLRQRAMTLLQEDPRTETADLHEIRIRVKQMRYCAQLLDECRRLDANDLMDALQQMQGLLGHWCDQVVATRVLSRLASRWRVVSGQPDLSAALLEYAACRARIAIEDREKVLEQWSRLVALVADAIPGVVDGDAANGATASGADAAASVEGGE